MVLVRRRCHASLVPPDRPGQSRGLPDITPALPLFSQLRRYTLAVLAAAESAADFAGILYTDAPPAGEADSLEPLDAIELESRMLMTMPAAGRLGQIKPEQPTTTYADSQGRDPERDCTLLEHAVQHRCWQFIRLQLQQRSP